eukprot:Em0006g1314a
MQSNSHIMMTSPSVTPQSTPNAVYAQVRFLNVVNCASFTIPAAIKLLRQSVNENVNEHCKCNFTIESADVICYDITRVTLRGTGSLLKVGNGCPVQIESLDDPECPIGNMSAQEAVLSDATDLTAGIAFGGVLLVPALPRGAQFISCDPFTLLVKLLFADDGNSAEGCVNLVSPVVFFFFLRKQYKEYLQKQDDILSQENKAKARARYKADPEKKKASVRDSYKADPEKKKASVRDPAVRLAKRAAERNAEAAVELPPLPPPAAAAAAAALPPLPPAEAAAELPPPPPAAAAAAAAAAALPSPPATSRSRSTAATTTSPTTGTSSIDTSAPTTTSPAALLAAASTTHMAPMARTRPPRP